MMNVDRHYTWWFCTKYEKLMDYALLKVKFILEFFDGVCLLLKVKFILEF